MSIMHNKDYKLQVQYIQADTQKCIRHEYKHAVRLISNYCTGPHHHHQFREGRSIVLAPRPRKTALLHRSAGEQFGILLKAESYISAMAEGCYS